MATKGFQDIPRFELHELKVVLGQLRCNTAADADGLVLELFKHASVELQSGLANIFNNMLEAGSFEPK